MNFLEKTEKAFKQKNWRFTKNVRIIVIFLNDQSFPISARSLVKNCGQKINVATVYRVCERLEKIKAIHKFHEKFIKCTNPNNKREEHHFLICEKCGGAEEIFLNYKNSISKQLARDKNFLLKRVELEFSGVCKHCHHR